jgi:type IV secretory pathway VirB4 component
MRIRPRHRAHTLTTASTGALYPCQAEPGLGGRGVYVGRDVSGGGAFCFDAWEAYDAGHITGRGTILAGALGKRKSTLAKSLIYRSVPFGRQAWVVDVKGEYERLCAAVGGSFISLEPGGSVRLNPLETRFGDPQRPRHRIRADQLDLLSSIVEASFRQADRVLRPEEHTAIEVALDEATAQAGGQPTLRDMVQVLLHPTADMAAAACADRPTLEAWSRDIGHQLRRLVTGDLGGMFDGHTSGTIDLSAPVVAFDVHRMQSSDALPILMTCAMSWLTAALARRDGTRRMLVLDEAWKLMERPGLLRYWQAAWKLCRHYDTQPIAIVHRLSDLTKAADQQSEAGRLAAGLLADSEIRIVYGQTSTEIDDIRRPLNLTPREALDIDDAPPGRGLWHVGRRRFLVDHRVTDEERAIVDTEIRRRAA